MVLTFFETNNDLEKCIEKEEIEKGLKYIQYVTSKGFGSESERVVFVSFLAATVYSVTELYTP